MKIWTCRNSPRSGSRNARTRIINVKGAIRLSKFWNFFGAIQMISCRDWWPWTKPDYITMTRRQSNNQYGGGIAPYPAPPQKFPSVKSAWKFLAWIFWDQDGILLIDYLPKGQTIIAEYYSYLLVQLKDILKEKRRGKFTKEVLFLHGNAPGHRTFVTQKKKAYLGFQCLDHPTCSLDWKITNLISPFFVRRGGHYSPPDLVGRTTFWFFFFEWLA